MEPVHYAVVCLFSVAISGLFVLRRLSRARATLKWDIIISPWFAAQVLVLCIALQTFLNLRAMIAQSDDTLDPWTMMILQLPQNSGLEAMSETLHEASKLDNLNEPTSDTQLADMQSSSPQKIEISKALPSWLRPGASLHLASIAGYGFLLFFLFGAFAWWRNRVNDKQRRRAIGVLPEDLMAIENAMCGEETVDEMLGVVLTSPCLARSLGNLRQRLIESTIKASGGELAGIMRLEREADNKASYTHLSATLETVGDWPCKHLEAAIEGVDRADVLEETELLRDHVALLMLTLFRRCDPTCPTLQEAHLSEELTDDAVREMNLMKRLAAGLLDQVLLKVCTRRRWLVATHSVLRLTALFTAGLPRDDAKGAAMMGQLLEKAGEPVPSIELRAELEGGGSMGEVPSGEIVTLVISCTRNHSDRFGASDVARSPREVKEAYWVVIEISNGERTLFGSISPLVVHRLADPVVTQRLRMQAPVNPGNYVVTFVARSPIIVGLSTSTTVSFSVPDDQSAHEEQSSDEEDDDRDPRALEID